LGAAVGALGNADTAALNTAVVTAANRRAGASLANRTAAIGKAAVSDLAVGAFGS
jgi:hypothetical protein